MLESPNAVPAALAFATDVMFLDIGMPELNGFDPARQMRQQASLQHIALVALSGWGADQDRERSQAAGIDNYPLTKPVMLDEVNASLARLASKASAQAAPCRCDTTGAGAWRGQRRITKPSPRARF